MHARNHGFALVTKDDDFLDLQALHGPPPAVTRLVLGNSSHAEVFAALPGARLPIEAVQSQAHTGVIEVAYFSDRGRPFQSDRGR